MITSFQRCCWHCRRNTLCVLSLATTTTSNCVVERTVCRREERRGLTEQRGEIYSCLANRIREKESNDADVDKAMVRRMPLTIAFCFELVKSLCKCTLEKWWRMSMFRFHWVDQWSGNLLNTDEKDIVLLRMTSRSSRKNERKRNYLAHRHSTYIIVRVRTDRRTVWTQNEEHNRHWVNTERDCSLSTPESIVRLVTCRCSAEELNHLYRSASFRISSWFVRWCSTDLCLRFESSLGEDRERNSSSFSGHWWATDRSTVSNYSSVKSEREHSRAVETERGRERSRSMSNHSDRPDGVEWRSLAHHECIVPVERESTTKNDNQTRVPFDCKWGKQYDWM